MAELPPAYDMNVVGEDTNDPEAENDSEEDNGSDDDDLDPSSVVLDLEDKGLTGKAGGEYDGIAAPLPHYSRRGVGIGQQALTPCRSSADAHQDPTTTQAPLPKLEQPRIDRGRVSV